MKILITVEFFWPHLGGAEEVVRHIAQGLVSLGHEVHVATSLDSRRQASVLQGVTIHEFEVSGNEVKGIRGEASRYRDFLRTFDCDVMLNYAAQNWTTDVAMQELGRIRARHRVLAPCGYSGLSTPIRRAAYWSYFRRLPERLRGYDLLIYHSDKFRDAEFGRRHGIRHSTTISNGVDAAELKAVSGRFRSQVKALDGRLIVNVSNHYRLKDHRTYLWLAQRQRAIASFALLGRNVAPKWQSCYGYCLRNAASVGVSLVEGDRGAVTSALADADLLVLTSHSEVAPIVLLEACAAGVPWLSFDVGNAQDLEGGIVVRSRSEMEEAFVDLVLTPERARHLGIQGRKYAEQNSWDKKVLAYERCFGKLMADKCEPIDT